MPNRCSSRIDFGTVGERTRTEPSNNFLQPASNETIEKNDVDESMEIDVDSNFHHATPNITMAGKMTEIISLLSITY